jgi:hypothetical protein
MQGHKPAFRTGAEEAKAASKGASFARTHYLSLDENEEVVVRPITDGHRIITVLQHQMVPTKKAPKDAENWPEKMGAVCRYDPAFDGVYADCFIDDNGLERNPKTGKPRKPAARNWMLACVREPVKEGGKIMGYRNKKREVAQIGKDGKPTGENTEELDIVVINLGHRNFTGTLLGFAGLYDTLLDRDYWIKREGTELDTVYRIAPLDPIEVDIIDPETGEPTGEVDILDLRDPQYMARYGFRDEDEAFEALAKIVEERASDEFYARFFDTRVKVDEEGKVSEASAAEQKAAATSAPSNDADPNQLEELRKRVRGYNPEAAAAGQEAEAEEGEVEAEPEPEPPAPPKAKTAPKKAPARAKPRDFG